MPEREIKTKTRARKQGEDVNDADKVWVTIKRTINLGNYESYTLDAGYSDTIKAGEDPIKKMEKMEEDISEFILEATDMIKEEYSDKPKRRRK